MTIPVPSGISSRRGLHRVVVDALGRGIVGRPVRRGLRHDGLLARMTGTLIASTVRGAGSVVEGRRAIGRNT